MINQSQVSGVRFEDLPEYLTPDELRQILRVGRTTIYDLLRRGDIAHVRFGRTIRIPKTALREIGPRM